MTGARRAAMAWGYPAADELLASLSGAGAVVEPLPSGSLPLVITPAIPGAADVCGWVTSVREPLDTVLRQAGALLFRGFDTATIEAFARLSDVFMDNMLTAHGRRPFTGDRRVLVAMGNSYLDALGRAEARLEADRRA